jgi:DNA-binding NarL/FixJ family response regulator
MTERIRVLVVDDDALVRAGLSMLLAGAEDIEIVGEAADGSEVAQAVAEHEPDVVLMDIRMPGMDGLAATELLRAEDDAPEVIVLTTFEADDYVLRALRAGASGFLLKDTPPADIVRAVRTVAAGEPMLSPAVTRRLIAEYVDRRGDQRRGQARGRLEALSEREREVLVLVGRGLSNADAAQALHMSEATVKTYVSRMLTKLGLANRTQAAILAHDAGLLK